jgi:DNA-directed RNA polymerase subunit M/transcription elongation factor TFIIS
MDILRNQTDSLQTLWLKVPAALQMDVLDILKSDLPPPEKAAAMEAATSVKTQEEFIPFNPLLRRERAEANDAAEALLYKPEVSKLSLECPFCRSKNTIIVSSQTRSADEATPVRIVCLSCSKTSIERG